MMFELNGRWTLRRNGCDELIAAQVPGCVHTDLLAAGKIADPFVSDNEKTLRWIFQESWIYQRKFDLPADFLQPSRILLCCEGLDTISHLFLNGKPLGSTDNMFRHWEFDVKTFLLPGTNQIEIRFDSPSEYIENRQKIRPMIYPTAEHQVAAFSQIRKAAFSFGWDWGPCLPTSGIWQPIYIRAIDAGRLLDVSTRQDHTDLRRVKLSVAVKAEYESLAEKSVRVTLKYGKEVMAQEVCPLEGSSREGSVDLWVEDPQLWWPIGMGTQPLYDLTVELLNEASVAFDVWERRIGLRTIRLDCSPDEWGHAFSFHVNGIPFFAKGTNWVPADALVTRISTEKYRQLLTAAADANMNMIRVWGGGIYEPDVFYDLCDELGLCVWQDFMFACAPYPLGDPEFGKNAAVEIEQQIKRLRHHASLALWCGNNELESCGFVATQGDDGHMSRENYQSFFEGTIPSLVATHSPEHDYWPGSPYKEAGESYNPDVWTESPGRGDVHIWTVWHLKKPFEYYRECHHRFISEFGLQSFPEPATVNRFAGPKDFDINSPVMRHHQRSAAGNTVIMEYLLEWFRAPRDFNATLWCSQILHGLAMKVACEHWRRAMPRTMGTLIWQLNDAWPAASWSGIDYFGQWKAMHFFARRFYSPLLVSGVEDVASGSVQVHVTSDLLHPVECSLAWKLTDLTGTLLSHGQTPVSAAAQTNGIVAELDFQNEISRQGAENLLVWLSLDHEDTTVSRNLVLFTRPRQLQLSDPELTCTVTAASEDSFVVTVVAKKPALWVWLELPEAHLSCSDNFFHLELATPMEILVHTPAKMTADQLAQSLQAQSLFDTYGGPTDQP